MNEERLHLLAAELRKWPTIQFYFGSWVGDNWQGKPDLSCGTTACALGVATTMPVFQALGLKLAKEYGSGYVTIEGVAPQMCSPDGFLNGHVSLVDTSLHSAMTIFDLTKHEATYLFTPGDQPYELGEELSDTDELDVSPDEYASPDQVADHIEAFIKWKLNRKGVKS